MDRGETGKGTSCCGCLKIASQSPVSSFVIESFSHQNVPTDNNIREGFIENTVSVLGRDKVYTVRFSPPPEGVPEGGGL